MTTLFIILAFITGGGISYFLLRTKTGRPAENEVVVLVEQQPETAVSVEETPPHAPKQEKTQDRLNNLILVNELSREITSSLDLNDSFKQVYHTINSMMDASVLELLVLDNELNRFFYSNAEYPGYNGKLTYYNHVSEWCLSNEKEVLLEDAEKDFGRYVFEPLILPDGRKAKSIICYPIHHSGKICGTLCVISFVTGAYETFHHEMIKLLTPFVGVAINNAFSHRQILDLMQRAERSEHFMQIFLANMSHEIRTPMNAVLGMTNLLLQKNHTPEQEKYLSTIRKSSENLMVILDDILDLSKIEAGKLELEFIPFSLEEVIENVTSIIRFKAGEKALEFHVSSDRNIVPHILGDPIRLTQILLNLLGNAVKFTDTGSVVLNISLLNTFAVQENGKAANRQKLAFSITDTGIGMSKEQQDKLFTDYTQASIEISRKYGGTGLGLSISRQLVKLHGGSITVASAPGKGSTFRFEIDYTVATHQTITPSREQLTPGQLAKLSGLKILLADDNEFNRLVVRETLELKLENVLIDEAENGQVALDMVVRNNYDLVLMDLIMPGINGTEATETIRSSFPAPKNQIPILALSASVQKSEIDKCMAAGMNGFIPKPFKIDQVLHIIYEVLRDGSAEFREVAGSVENTGTQGLIDFGYVDKISDGDPVRIKRYAALFIDSVPEYLRRMEAAYAAGDAEALRIAAHSLKAIVKFNGFMRGFDLLEAIESNALGDREELAELIDNFREAYNTVLPQISSISAG